MREAHFDPKHRCSLIACPWSSLSSDLLCALLLHLEPSSGVICSSLEPKSCYLTQVLNIYPSTIRRRILRHLYLDQLHKCFLFADCKLKFLDAILAGARVELFMPQVRRQFGCKPGGCRSNHVWKACKFPEGWTTRVQSLAGTC